jgi:hypothetical protein
MTSSRRTRGPRHELHSWRGFAEKRERGFPLGHERLAMFARTTGRACRHRRANLGDGRETRAPRTSSETSSRHTACLCRGHKCNDKRALPRAQRDGRQRPVRADTASRMTG